MVEILWKDAPEEHDYPAALEYLCLVMSTRWARPTVEAMRGAGPSTIKAKDILRASELLPLNDRNPHVARDIDKINEGKSLSPILLVRGDMAMSRRPLIIADGYHRVCAAYHLDEDAEVPCRIVTPRNY